MRYCGTCISFDQDLIDDDGRVNVFVTHQHVKDILKEHVYGSSFFLVVWTMCCAKGNRERKTCRHHPETSERKG